GRLNYCTKLFAESTMRRFIVHFKNVIQQIVTNPEKSIDTIQLVTEDEIHLLVREFNNSRSIFEEKTSIIEFFEAQVEQIPNQVAVVLGGTEEKITYLQ
ncbi:hypothetical protein J9332_39655, partial [Aquimarina celericrescens]|nr:hypothetical protein [Aquimarina celericrescens]